MSISSSRPHHALALAAGLALLILPAPPQASAAKQVFDVTGNWIGSAHGGGQNLDFIGALTGGHGKSITGTVSANGVTLPVHGSITPSNTVKLSARQGALRVKLSGHLDSQTVTITGNLTIQQGHQKGTGPFTMTRSATVP